MRVVCRMLLSIHHLVLLRRNGALTFTLVWLVGFTAAAMCKSRGGVFIESSCTWCVRSIGRLVSHGINSSSSFSCADKQCMHRCCGVDVDMLQMLAIAGASAAVTTVADAADLGMALDRLERLQRGC